MGRRGPENERNPNPSRSSDSKLDRHCCYFFFSAVSFIPIIAHVMYLHLNSPPPPQHTAASSPLPEHVAVLLSGTLAGPVLLITVSCCAHLQMLHPRLGGLQTLHHWFR